MADGRLKFRDCLYVLLLGAAIAALAWAWQFEAPPPDLADSLAAAAGLRPPKEPFCLLWHYIAAPICRDFGLQAACKVLRIAGHVSLGILAVLITALFRMMLPKTLRRGEHIALWWRVAVRFVLYQGTVLFSCSEPVWTAFRWFSPLSLQVLIFVLAAICYVAYLKTERKAPLFVAYALMGVVSADTPAGLVLLVFMSVGLAVRRYMRNAGLVATSEENPFAAALMSWRLTLSFAVGAIAGMTLEIRAFDSLDGLAAFGWTQDERAYEFPIAYLKAFLSMCSPAGFAIAVAVVFLPVIVEFLLVRLATDDEKHLAYLHGVMFLGAGLVAFSQLTGAESLWFWTWGGEERCLTDGLLKCFAMCLCATSVFWALGVFTTELYLRNFRRIETLRFQDAAETKGALDALAPMTRMQRIVRACLLAEPVLALACVIPFRAQGMERAMLGIIADAAKETAEECSGVEYLFTDGGIDAIVELAAASAGHSLRTLSLMGSAEDARETYLRTRGVKDAEDLALLKSGAADALRTWVRSRPDKTGSYAVQIGFELWRRDGRPMPECSGLAARPDGFPPGEAERGAAAGRALSERLLALYDDGDPDETLDRSLRDAFLFVQWRLAVLARHRANAYDGRGETSLAMEETRIADALDKKNGALDRIRMTMAWAGRRKLERMTPQEGLRLGLARADFALARVFALRVLDISPNDPAANFALGMDFFVQKQYARAQAYLERCLERRPDDPAVLNNLAQCRLRQGDPAGALPYAEHAQEILPDSPEIRRTMERIRAALKESGTAR